MYRYLTDLLLVMIWILPVSGITQPMNPFAEYHQEEFEFKGHEAKIVFPKNKHPENLWIWRARFWGHEPQLDEALLEMGFHVVYVDVAGLFGNQQAVDLWDQFYIHCINKYELSDKVVLEGMSRGGLIVYNWASKNTEKVYCIYADAPVCDLRSWPGGFYSSDRREEAWRQCLEAHQVDSSSIETYQQMPIYTANAVAQAGIPAIHVCGDADDVVPYKENTQVLAQTFRAAGGEIKIILKEGVGHHPHSLEDPTPILDFILDAIQ